MSLDVTVTPDWGFVRNPIMLKIKSNTTTTYNLVVDEEVVYEGSGSGNYELNLSEILEPFMFSTRFNENDPAFIMNMPPNSNYRVMSVNVLEATGAKSNVEFDVWFGGLSKRDLRYYSSSGRNIFLDKFYNKKSNFFFTTRSNKWYFSMRENEILPLLFHNRSDLTIRDNYNNSLQLSSGGGCRGLNIKAIRHEFFSRHSTIPSYFDVYVDDFACRIGIERSEVCDETYKLLFLNSFGAYEIIELCGSASIVPESSDDQEYNVFDSMVDDFVLARARKNSRDVINVSTGIKRHDELRHLLDAINSDDVYFIDGSNEYKVIPSAKDLNIDLLSKEPKEIELTLKMVETESNFNMDVAHADYNKPRLHSKEFSEQFN